MLEGKSLDGDIVTHLYPPSEEEGEEVGGMYIHVAGMSIGLEADKYEFLEILADCLKHVRITEVD